MGPSSFEGEMIGTKQTPGPSIDVLFLSRSQLYSQVRCKITENAAVPKLPPWAPSQQQVSRIHAK